MGAMDRRIAALEAAGGETLTPDIKVWLGMPLTAAEQRLIDAAADDQAGIEPDWDSIDTSTWSGELKAWLGVE